MSGARVAAWARDHVAAPSGGRSALRCRDMSLREVVIDERTRAEGSPARQIEWDAAIRELLDPSVLVVREDAHRLAITVTQQRIVLLLTAADGASLGEIEVPHDRLAKNVQEYIDIVRQLAREDGAGGLARLEALDMAKKVTHDQAARVLERLCRPFAFDHETSRRLFTLLLTLRVDTTRLVGVHSHRRIR